MHYVLSHLCGQVNREHQVTAVVGAETDATLFPPWTPLLRVPVDGTGLQLSALNPLAFWRLVAAIRKFRPDAVHLAGPHAWNPILALIFRREAGICFTNHDPVPHPGQRLPGLLRLYNRCLSALAHVTIVHGERWRAHVRGRHVHVIPLLHLPGGHGFAMTGAGRAPEPPPMALFAGRLKRYKGLDTLLAAAAELQRRSPKARIVIAGAGSLAEACPGSTVPAGVTVLERFLDPSELAELISRATVVVLPYSSATQSAMVAAAHAASRPVVVTAAGALAESVQPGSTGLVVAAGDIDGLAGAMEQILGDPYRAAEMGAAGLVRYREQLAAEARLLQLAYRTAVEAQRDAMGPR